jgi:hypothetical protein
MKKDYIINNRPHWGTKPMFIVVFNWEGSNEVDNMPWSEMNLKNCYMPEKATVAVFKIKWK